MTEIIPLNVPISIKENNGIPAIELRKVLSDKETLKQIISCAFHEKPIIIIPKFSNRLLSLSTLIDKGLIYIDKETGEYKFTF